MVKYNAGVMEFWSDGVAVFAINGFGYAELNWSFGVMGQNCLSI
jgi:hypothetical protein